VLNAANEVAVGSFLAGDLGFDGIPAVVEATLEEMPAATPGHFEDLFACDEEARRLAATHVARAAAGTGIAAGNGSAGA
jgi:1-deoxy-D-xylulose-5-phosphate reductoisomerase